MQSSPSVASEPCSRTIVCAGSLLTVFVLVLLDGVRMSIHAPRVSLGASTLAFLAVGWAAGSLLACSALLTRAELAARLARHGGGGMALLGALDASVLLLLVFVAQDPRTIAANLRVTISVVAVVCIAGTQWFWFARGEALPRWVRPLTALCGVGACAWLLSKLRWNGEDWFRLALHLFLAVCIVELIRLAARGRSRRWVVAGLALAGLGLFGSSALLRAFPDARLAVHHRSSHVRTWLRVFEVLFDRDGDGTVPLFCGVFADQQRIARAGVSTLELTDFRFDAKRAAGAPSRDHAPGAEAPFGFGSAAGRDVLLLSIDSLRWDAMKHLAELREAIGDHVVFEAAVSPAPATKESLSATLRGRPVRQLKFESADAGGLILWRDPHPTLGHVLQPAGYRVLTVPTSNIGDPRLGVQAGFESVWVANFDARAYAPSRPPHAQSFVAAEEALPVVLEAARTTPLPLCAWVHVMESHAPYHLSDPSACDRSRPADCYAAALRETSRRLAEFVRAITSIRGRAPVIAVFGDHGDEFGEHGGDFHGSSLHAEQVRVGFLLAVPGAPGKRVTAPVSTASLPATILDLLGLATPSSMVEPSLLPGLAGRRSWPAITASELRLDKRFMTAYTSERFRYLNDAAHGVELLFDMARDPFEQVDIKHNLAALASMRELARAWDEAH